MSAAAPSPEFPAVSKQSPPDLPSTTALGLIPSLYDRDLKPMPGSARHRSRFACPQRQCCSDLTRAWEDSGAVDAAWGSAYSKSRHDPVKGKCSSRASRVLGRVSMRHKTCCCRFGNVQTPSSFSHDCHRGARAQRHIRGTPACSVNRVAQTDRVSHVRPTLVTAAGTHWGVQVAQVALGLSRSAVQTGGESSTPWRVSILTKLDSRVWLCLPCRRQSARTTWS